MNKFKCRPGWTKEKMISAILSRMQDHKSINPNVLCGAAIYCAYRAPDGNRCAIGVFIPDSLYRDTMEGHFASEEWLSPRVMMKMPLDQGLLKMQKTHDSECIDDEDPRPYICAWIDEYVEDISNA